MMTTTLITGALLLIQAAPAPRPEPPPSLLALAPLHAMRLLQDPADSVWRAARRAINEGDYARAAQLYARLHQEERYRASEYRGQAHYWEAFARARLGGQAELRRARAALEVMRSQHAADWRAQRDAAALLTRVNAELAQRGDARAAADVQARGVAAARAGCDEASMATKVEAMNALLQMDSEQAMPILEEVMKKRDACSAELRRKAIFLISQKHGANAHQLILEAVRNDPDPEVRQQAVFWLSQVSGDAALRALEQVLANGSDRKLQEHALFALSQHRSERAAELLRTYALRGDLSTELRKHAIFAIGQRPDTDNAAFLMELYPRLEADLREMVIFSVGQQRDARAAAWLLEILQNEREAVQLRKHALFWAGQQGSVDVATLGRMYDRMPGAEMKEQVIFVLAQKRDAEAVDRLMQIARTEKDPALRKQAIFWLGQSKDPRAARFLLEIINN